MKATRLLEVMKMKCIFGFTALLLTVFLFAACSEHLDQTPENGNKNTSTEIITVSDEADPVGPVDLKDPIDPEDLVDLNDPILPSVDDSEVSVPVELDMVWVNPGSFIMGIAEEDYNPRDDDLNGGLGLYAPQHKVTLTNGFFMGKYEVTQKQFKDVMGYNPSYFTIESWIGKWHNRIFSDNAPVERVSWYEAVEFCNKLSILEGLEPVYTFTAIDAVWFNVKRDKTANGYRLPTEAEWEYACRAGTTTKYPTGDSLSHEQENVFVGILDQTQEVGSRQPNAWGLYDMNGNVNEWCDDYFGGYNAEGKDLGTLYFDFETKRMALNNISDPDIRAAADEILWNDYMAEVNSWPLADRIDPTGPISIPVPGLSRVVRGGSYIMPPVYSEYLLRSGNRTQLNLSLGGVPENYKYSSIGFRVVRP